MLGKRVRSFILLCYLLGLGRYHELGRHYRTMLIAWAEDFEAAKAKALKIGACACYIEDLREEFIKELCFPAVQCNAIYENVYLLGE